MRLSKKLAEEYVAETTGNISFPKFISANKKKIIDISLAERKTAKSLLDLQTYWIATLNGCIIDKDTRAKLISQHSVICKDFEEEVYEKFKKPIGKEEHKNEAEVPEFPEVQNDDQEENLGVIIKKKYMKKYMKKYGDSLEHDKQFRKLIDSKPLCISLLNPEDKERFKGLIPESSYKDIEDECLRRKQDFKNTIKPKTSKMLDNTLTEFKKIWWERSENIDKVIHYIDVKKAEILKKDKKKYLLYSILDTLVKDIRITDKKKSKEPSENSYVCNFINILKDLLLKSELILKDGEGVSRCTQITHVDSEGTNSYGRRIDLIIASEKVEGKILELCNIEFKKQKETEAELRKQQNKNFRTNASALNNMHRIMGDTKNQISYFEFAGTHAYINQVFAYEDCYVTHTLGDFVIPQTLPQLVNLNELLRSLYTWRQEVANNCFLMRTILENEKENRSKMSKAYCPVTDTEDKPPKAKIEKARIISSPNLKYTKSPKDPQPLENLQPLEDPQPLENPQPLEDSKPPKDSPNR